jgi:lipoprotein-anchoring transpeptidase ErfK/SrfK
MLRALKRGDAAGALLLAAACAAVVLAGLSSAGSAGADPGRRASTVEVAGAGTLLREQVVVRSRPTPESSRVTVLRQFRADFRPQVVLALSVKHDEDGEPTWYRVSVPGRPNGRTGWIRASALELQPVRKRIVIYRGARKFEFWNGNKLVRTGKVAVGKPGAETPLGLFYVTWKFNPSRDPNWAILGKYAFETSAYSKLTDWPGGGIVGVHGTPWPELLGQAVSHGCIRLSNENILFLRHRVPLGTPVKIVR